MVRETRHLWVGNLPDNIRDDRIREHFKRYGRVQNVKLLGRTDAVSTITNGASGVCATVAFMDIKSASKAHNAEHVLDERTLTTEYYEPAAIPSSAGAPSAGSSPAGSGYSGSSSSVNSAPAPTPASRYHLSGGEDSASSTCPIAASAAAPVTWRGTNDSATEYCRRGNTPAAYGRYQRNNSTAPYSTPPSNVERTTPHHRWYASGERPVGATGGESTPSTPGGGTEGGRRRRHSGSGSSRSDSSSPEPSDTSRASTPATQPPLSHHANHRTPPSLQHQWASTASGRPLAICVRNLPTRSTDSSLKDGLYHEYKKHGKVVWVKVVGQNADRYAVVRFKKPSDVEKALEVSQDKLFFGCKISVAPHQSCEEDADSAKPYETDIDEYHPKATRTLFIGNLEKDVTQQQLRDKFKHFGRIIEIDIKKGSGGGAGYAFCQYASISSVVEAIRAMDGEYVGGSRVKLGFGKPVATTCVWVDGLTEHTEKQVLGAVSRCGAATSVCVDRAAGAALVHFEQAAAAGAAVRELRRVAAAASAAEPDHPRLCVDYASRECQDAFYEQLEKHGGSAALTGSERLSSDIAGRYLPTTRHEPIRYDGGGSRSRASSYGRSSSRTPRYSTLEQYDPADYAADRRYRVYDELGSSPQNEDTPYEDRLQSVVVSPLLARKHRRDSSPDERKHSKERHRSVGGVAVSRRSRSGSRSERHLARRRHRRRRDGSGSRAGTPLRDEPDAPPSEPRRPPRERPPLPMSLPLPRFAAQLLRAAPPAPRPAPAPAPDSPPRPPSASSSSAGSAPHSPSLEERIRSLDEKYEKWSGSRVIADTPDRTRLRHRLLDVDINEVKPSEVVRSLLAKRSVFDEDSERLEGAGRAASPAGSPRARPPAGAPRYSFPALDDAHDRPHDPRLNRPERLPRLEKLGKFNESDYRLESRAHPRTPSPDRSQRHERRLSVVSDDREDDLRLDNQKKSRESLSVSGESESKSSFDCEMKDMGDRLNVDGTYKSTINEYSTFVEKQQILKKELAQNNTLLCNQSIGSNIQHEKEECTARDVMEMLLKRVEISQNSQPEKRYKCSTESIPTKTEFQAKDEEKLKSGNENKIDNLQPLQDTEKSNDLIVHNHITKELLEFEMQHNHLNTVNSLKSSKEHSELHYEMTKINNDKNGKERYMNHSILEAYHNTRFEKENIQFDKPFTGNSNFVPEKRVLDIEKNLDDNSKDDREKNRHGKDRSDKDKIDLEKEKLHSNKNEKKIKDDHSSDKVDKIKTEKDFEKKNKFDREVEKVKHNDEKTHNHKKERLEKEKRKDIVDSDSLNKLKKEEKHKYDRHKKDSENSKRDIKKEGEVSKSRKSSRDETSREVLRKDSTDSSTSRTSHESVRHSEIDFNDVKEDSKPKFCDIFGKLETGKELLVKLIDSKLDISTKLKTEVKEENHTLDNLTKIKSDKINETARPKDATEKQRHYSVDSMSLDSKRKERLNSCSSLPCNIGHKRRMSSQDSFDSLSEEIKKSKNEGKIPERRESKDCRNSDRHKPTKFSKGHFAKIIESKTKDDKKNQVKPPDEIQTECVMKEKDKNKSARRSPVCDEKFNTDEHQEGLHNDLDFLATLELRSSEEDERQKALRKEMKEKKRIQQLLQIQELQMQQDAMQQAEISGKLKDDKKLKSEEKRKEVAREKRMSIDRKSREEKNDCMKRKNRKQVQTSDTSDSDEPKKHSIFDIIDDGPTYISMYDKVKARSCKNMQKQEEEKRQEKIKAKFSQLKQSRAKREEKKRSSWDEDSDSDQDRKQTLKSSMDNTSDDENTASNNKRREKHLGYDRRRSDDYFEFSANEEDLRNKLSRKNSRTRIISDSSDDDISKNCPSKSHSYLNDVKKELTSNSESLQRSKDDFKIKDSNDDKMKKNSLLNLFGKSDSDDSKIKSSHEVDNDYKIGFVKTLLNDFSSESESLISNRHLIEMRKKHKKKQKRHKSYSDDELKIDNSDTSALETEIKYRNIEKQRRHSNKKDKRKDKSRESVDTDDNREDRMKPRRERKSSSFDYTSETVPNNLKKDGKMEDIFGPLSDDSDNDTKPHQNKCDFLSHEYNSTYCESEQFLQQNTDLKIKEEKRRKEKKRKDKRYIKDDDNSLDVDAVSKAIEARLFAESLVDEENRMRNESLSETVVNINHNNVKYGENDLMNDIFKNDSVKKECKEKKKKKKRSKEDRIVRKEQPFYHLDKFEKQDNDLCENVTVDLSTKTPLLDIPLPTDTQSYGLGDKFDDNKSISESHSLPRLTDSPPLSRTTEKKGGHDTFEHLPIDDNNRIDLDKEEIEVDKIPMPPSFDNTIEDISEVPLPKDPVPIQSDLNKLDNFKATFNNDNDVNDGAVRSISNLPNDNEKIIADKSDKDSHSKLEKKVEEKPRAVISQEETEDAVAALLGESFGGKINAFTNCYEENENESEHQNEIENIAIETENIPEEDAEEMRQAVQNLNASEMETKPDTPVSDSDMLLIDTDNDEAEDTPQDAIERLPVNVIATSQSLTATTKQSKSTTEQTKTEVISNIVMPKNKVNLDKASNAEGNLPNTKSNESNTKIHLVSRENVQIITSSATPVITSWTLTKNKTQEPPILNIQANTPNREKPEIKSTHITTNIVQIKPTPSQCIQLSNTLRPTVPPVRINTPNQAKTQIIRAQTPNLQPPTIKIPESHIVYQKQPGIVISPRMSNDPRMQSPKKSPQSEAMVSPRLTNMTMLNTASQNLSSVGLTSPNTIQQRSPGQVTVVRMQQPPLSPIQALHLPHGARTMVSPNRPNSVLVQTPGAPIHFNRLPVTPVLAPISKQISVNNILPQNKVISVNSSALIHQPKIMTGDGRKIEQRNIAENVTDASKVIISPTSWQQSKNPTVLAQNRLISMQNTMHVSNLNSATHLSNKVLINNINQLSDKRENQAQKSELFNHGSFAASPIHANHSKASIIQSVSKPITCNVQDNTMNMGRGQGSNVIHTINSQRLLTSVPMVPSNVIQIDANKCTPSVLSMATTKPSNTTKSEPSLTTAVTTITCASATALLLKTSDVASPLRLNTKIEKEASSPESLPNNSQRDVEMKVDEKSETEKNLLNNDSEIIQATVPPTENVAKSETDFEELLKDNTNEIKITNSPEKKLEVNCGKTLTKIPAQLREKQLSFNIEDVSNDTSHVTSGQPDVPNTLYVDKNMNPENNEDSINSSLVKPDITGTGTALTEEANSNSQIQSDKLFSNVSEEEPKKSSNLKTASFVNDISFMKLSDSQNDSNDSQIKTLDENDSWSGKDVNIESVIKKVDSLCNETIDLNDEKDQFAVNNESKDIKSDEENQGIIVSSNQNVNNLEHESVQDSNLTEESSTCKVITFSKRGGRNGRGKKIDKNMDRVQTRQISKPSRGTNSKRGRGRAKIDKKVKNFVNPNTNSIPGDVYDFHEDSGDEASHSPNKNETRPRLILTIKSPLSGHANMIATSTLTIKDQVKCIDKICKDEKNDDFISPSQNTRKSRRLQEKDVQKTTVDEIIEDVIKGAAIQSRVVKDPNKKKQTKQTGRIEKTSTAEKAVGLDTRKSPRGAKRTRDRSLSDASLDSGDEKVSRKDGVKEPKQARLDEPTAATGAEPDPPAPARTAPPLTQSSPPTPIMKPPKKMISEISAKLGCAFEAGVAVSAPPPPAEPEPPPPDALGAATGCPPDTCAPVGATEASDARVQSPALPHRPPSTHRPADRATPLLIRGSEVEGKGIGAGAGAGAGAAGGALARQRYAATASLPRGAHHPPPPDPLPHLKLRAPTPHYHHPHTAAASRVTITSVPSISPQGQIGGMGDGMYPHFSHQHYQMYQQHFRATQHESRASPSPYTRSLEAEGSEAPTPPLELRRPLSARVPRPAHSPSPADRLIMYAVGCGRSPPPAHGTSRLAGALPPGAAPGPPHASQVPREADSLQMLLRRYPVMWQGLLALKNDSAAVQMHFVGGNPGVAGEALSRHADLTPLLRIAQRMRLEPAQLDQVHRKMKMENEHCILLALPCGRDHMDVLQQSTNLTAGFITYLQRKQAAGIVNVAPPGHHQAMYTVHIFPSCEFANENLTRIAPDLMHRVADIAHLLIVIATV